MFVLILNQIFSGFYYLFGVLYILIFQLSISTFWLPVFAIRLIAIQIAKWRPDFGEILSTTDVLLSEDVTKKHRGSAMITLALKGIISADEMRTLNDPNFKIENYIHEDISQKDDPDFRSLETILENVSYRPYPSKRSAWEMFLVPNFKDPKFQPNSEPTTLLVLRIHHTQIDGYSLLNVLVKGLAQKATYVTPKPTTLENTDVFNFFNSIPKFIEGFVGGQTRYLHNLRFRRAIEDRNPKAIQRQSSCSTDGHGWTNLTKIFEKSEKVPKTAYASYGVPMPNHPGRLTNHVKVGMMTISLSNKILWSG
ncbi:hypothetical protein Ocin01_19271 [Orchesella cincta]|uniref:O-acyltransferase WSD1 C-terminal domain-containing protein n=1 Tax=Orchesella cincta TaxID=48709 RepID=A0A1D2M3C3_ORCCI|nr:hypothetical protein Ocin01_19271 [Orchesella cincta]